MKQYFKSCIQELLAIVQRVSCQQYKFRFFVYLTAKNNKLFNLVRLYTISFFNVMNYTYKAAKDRST